MNAAVATFNVKVKTSSDWVKHCWCTKKQLMSFSCMLFDNLFALCEIDTAVKNCIDCLIQKNFSSFHCNCHSSYVLKLKMNFYNHLWYVNTVILISLSNTDKILNFLSRLLFLVKTHTEFKCRTNLTNHHIISFQDIHFFKELIMSFHHKFSCSS